MLTSITSWATSAKEYIYSYASLENDDGARRKQLKYAAIGSVSALTVSCIAYYMRTVSRNKKNRALASYFSTNYHEARGKFREAASKIPTAKQHAIVIDTECDLTIDLCYIPGDKASKHVVLHFSGTHGVEGFAGSAIQIHLLQHELCELINSASTNNSNNNKQRPHILLIHTLNPYGMAYNRRWNKGNVDLNRNCILDRDIWDQVRSREWETSAYKKVDHLVNPPRKPTFMSDDLGFWFTVARAVWFYGYQPLKKVIVEGQYVTKTGVFYGGHQLAVEHDMLCQFLTQECGDKEKFGVNLCDMATQLTLIDVHTGLGKYGVDYLLLDSGTDVLKPLLPTYDQQARLMNMEVDGFWKQMYKDSIGNVSSPQCGYPTLFKNVDAKNALVLAEEFGTYHPVSVFKALRNENMAYHYSQGQSLDDEKVFYRRGIDVRNVFYPHDDPAWKNSVLQKGVHLFHTLLWR